MLSLAGLAPTQHQTPTRHCQCCARTCNLSECAHNFFLLLASIPRTLWSPATVTVTVVTTPHHNVHANAVGITASAALPLDMPWPHSAVVGAVPALTTQSRPTTQSRATTQSAFPSLLITAAGSKTLHTCLDATSPMLLSCCPACIGAGCADTTQ